MRASRAAGESGPPVPPDELGTGVFMGSVVVALFAGGKRDGQAIAGRRKRARRVRSVGAGGIFEFVEIENKFAGLAESVGGEAGIEKTAGRIGGGGAGGVLENEEKLLGIGLLENGFEAIGFSIKREFGGAGNGLRVRRVRESDEHDGLWRVVGNPVGREAIVWVGGEPMESVKIDECGRPGVFDTESETAGAANGVHIERADGEMRIVFVVVRVDAQSLGFGGSASDEEAGSESAGRRKKLNGVVFEMHDADVRGMAGGELDFVVRRGAEGIVAGLKPFESGEGQPSVEFLQVGGVLGAPGGEIALPSGVLRGSGADKQNGSKGQKQNRGGCCERWLKRTHTKV